MTDTADRIARWLRANSGRVGLPSGSKPTVSLIGTGESYAAWLARFPGADSLVVRIPRRPVDQLPRPMAAEVAGLALAPPGLGPRAVLFEESAEPLGAPFMVTGYVPGREVSAEDWDDELLRAHARQLAALHATPFAAAGDVLVPAQDRSAGLSLVARLAESLDWWRRAHPDVLADPEVARLVPEVERHIAMAEPAFTRLRRFALIHGDLVVPNILVDAGTPRYVDWEWVEIGDPAQDLAYIGGPVAAPPWYVPLTPERVDRFLAAYTAHAGDAAGPVADLRVRRDAFEIFERFFSSLHFRTQRGTEEDRRTCRYTEAVHLLTAGLREALRRNTPGVGDDGRGMTHDKPAKMEPAVRELAERLREHGYEIVHVSGAPPGSGGGHVELYYGTFHVGQMTRGESGEWEVAFTGSGEEGPEPDPGQQVPEHRQNPATMYFAYCPLNSHEPGLPGVTKDGRWYGGLVETHEAALNEANAHGHGEAVVETYHR